MIFTSQPNSIAPLLRSYVALTPEQAALIKDEIANDPTGRGYAGKANAIQLELLVSAYVSSGPTVEPKVKRRGSISSDTLWNELNYLPSTTPDVSVLAILLAASVTPESPLFGPALVITKTLGGGMSSIDFDSPTAYARVKALADGLVEAGIMLQEAADSILCGTQHPSRLDEVLGTEGAVIMLDEYETAINS